MNIQHRTAATLPLPGLSTTAELARTARNEGLGTREELLAVTYEHVGVGIVEVDEAGRMLPLIRWSAS